MQEKELHLPSGWPMLFLLVLVVPAGITALFVWAGIEKYWPPAAVGGLLIIIWFIGLFGFISVSPNEARVVQLFGKYVGTLKDVGLRYGNPFYSAPKVSIRVQTFETGQVSSPEKIDPTTGKVVETGTKKRQPSKVNDRDGTPIEIAAVVVWKVVNTAQAVFEVDNYQEYVQIQSEAALRNLASRYSYDLHESDSFSLRAHPEEVGEQLKKELHVRMIHAGIEILEARISYLAYAPEIASAMLQRQQAGAIIAARQRIVEGAVGMVEHALEMLSAKKVIDLDEERKAAMVSNLLVVLCGHSTPQPVVNTGTIYQ